MSISSNEYYTIDGNGSASVYIGLYWGQTSGVTNPANLRVARWNGAMWENKGTIGYLGTTDSGSVYSDIVNSFSPFVLAL